ncbi:MAG: DUF3126 family protein [Pseudomonadota bacterium]
MNASEVARLQKYLQDKFAAPAIEVRRRPNKDDSAEVYLGEEFIGVLFRDADEGEISYDFNMAILDIDLPPAES